MKRLSIEKQEFLEVCDQNIKVPGKKDGPYSHIHVLEGNNGLQVHLPLLLTLSFFTVLSPHAAHTAKLEFFVSQDKPGFGLATSSSSFTPHILISKNIGNPVRFGGELWL